MKDHLYHHLLNPKDMAILEPVNFWLSVVIVLIVVGEAVALWIGMNFVSESAQEWLTPKNNLLLLIDIISGILVLYLVILQREEMFTSPLFYLAIVVIIITHLWRDLEHLIDFHDIFLANSGLLIVNNIKLIGAIISLLLAILPNNGS